MNNQVFSSALLNKASDRLPWWTRFCLFFCKTHSAYDPADESGTMLFYKTFRGRVYIVAESTNKTK